VRPSPGQTPPRGSAPRPEPRAETVGSLLRSAAVLRAARRGSVADQAVLDDAALDAIRLQEDIGLDVITDGEVRRTGWVQTPRWLDAFTVTDGRGTLNWRGGRGGARMSGVGQGSAHGGYPAVTRRVATATRTGDMTAEYAFLASRARSRTKFTMPAPSYHRRFWSQEHSRAVYGTCEEYLEEIRDFLRESVQALLALGCDYIQLDAPNYGSYCDPGTRARMAAEGRDPDADLAFDAELDNSLIDGLSPWGAASARNTPARREDPASPPGPAGGSPGSLEAAPVPRSASPEPDRRQSPLAPRGVTTALHICRGNGPAGMWHSAGGYGAISASLFPKLTFGRLLLEYDSERAGGFEPLRDVRPETVVVLGLLTTKSDEPDDEAKVAARIAEAARYKPLAELALSTQCGFASAPGDNPVTPAGQRAKLEMVARLARRTWQ
jgi:5-methyltetrahydropteroyltriglutamate--homocysteine methyltransferase